MGSLLVKNQQASPENMSSEKREYKKMMQLGNDTVLNDISEGKSEKLTVLSYNVLADCYTYFLGFVSNFKSCEKKYLNFYYRASIVVSNT